MLVVWRVQLGGDYAAASIADPRGEVGRLVDHYLHFPLRALGLLLPGVLWLPCALKRNWSNTYGMQEDLRRLLICGTLIPFLVFYLYPESRPRHVMAVFFPMAVLAGMVASRPRTAFNSRTSTAGTAALVLSPVPMALTAAGLVLTTSVRPMHVPWAMLVLVVGTAWSWIAYRLTRQTPAEFGMLSFALAIVSILLSAWFAFNSVVIPWKRATNSARGAEELSRRLPPDAVVYTTRTFPTKGDRYFNLQFHLAKNLRAADNLEDLKRAAPCLAVVTAAERAELEDAGWIIKEIGRIGGTPGAPPEVYVVRISAPSPNRGGD